MESDLRHVNEALDAFADRYEGSKRNGLGDRAVEDGAGFGRSSELVPRVFPRLAYREGDPFAVAIDLEHLDLDLVAHRHHLAGMADVLP